MPLQNDPFPRLAVMATDENFRGHSYSDLIELWANWLLGPYPDYRDGGDILFLRGNIGYYADSTSAYDRTGNNSITVFSGTSVLIPVMTAMFHSGHSRDGYNLDNGEAMREAVRADINSSGDIWARIQRRDEDMYKIVEDLEHFYVESRLCALKVSEQNPFRDKLEFPIEPGTYDMVVGGIVIFIKELPVGEYSLWFGGKGRGVYYTDAYYDIKVRDQRRPKFLNDISFDPHARPKQVQRPPTP
jgi:hypothetical protein